MSSCDRALLDGLPLLASMPPDLRRLVAACFTPATYCFGELIVSEGDDADALYVVSSGRARVLKAAASGGEVTLRVLEPGDSFGEIALLRSTTRSASVRASSDVGVLRLEAAVFAALAASHPQMADHLELQARERALTSFFRLESEFGDLSRETLNALLRELEPVDVDAGEVVIRQGEAAGALYIVRDGRLRARVHKEDTAYYAAGDFFGETSLLTGAARAATVDALTDCRLLRITPQALSRLLEHHPALRTSLERRVARYDYRRTANVPLDFAEELLPADAEPRPPVAVTEDRPPQGEDLPDSALDTAGPVSADPRAVTRRRRRRFPHVWQVDEMDCGAACLAMVCRDFGRPVSLARVRQAVRTGVDGTSLAGITRGAQELGLAARAVKSSTRNLDTMPLPAVVHWDAHHWVVLYAVTGTHVRIADPALGLRRLPRTEMEQRWSGYTALLDRTPAFDETPVGGADFSWVRPLLARHRTGLVAAALIALAVSALQLALPVFLQVVVDRVLPERDVGLLRLMLLGMAGVVAVMLVGGVAHRYLLSVIAVRLDGSALDVLSQRLLALPMPYFYARRTGDIQRRLAGMQQARQFLVQHGVVALTSIAQLLTAVALMLVYSPFLAVVFLASVPAYAGLMRFASIRLRPVFDSLEESFGRYYSRQVDAVRGMETVKAMGAEDALRHSLLAEFEALRRRLLRADLTAMLYEGGIQLVAFSSIVVFAWAGSLQVLNGSLSVGEFVSFNALVVLANGPVIALLATWDQLQLVRVLMSRLSDVFEHEPEQGGDKSWLRPVPSLSGRVTLEDVGFQYGGPESPHILRGLSFDVTPGSTVAIVGRSGSGKTTLAKCLAGLIEPTHGVIRYDGADMASLDYRHLRRRIGFVLQENFLFSESIARNIAFGDEVPDMQRVEWAARAANAHEFVVRLPLRYETRVGETGLLLSGGQRQRIAIARAIYRRPPILVLDEATSSLDAESERAVQDNLGRLLEGRTSFIIAHRLSTIRHADRILVLDRGQLVEQGTHQELIDRRGLYYFLSSEQLEV